MTLASPITADPGPAPQAMFELGVVLAALERAVERADMTAVLEQSIALDALIVQVSGQTDNAKARAALERAAGRVNRLIAELAAQQGTAGVQKADPRRAYAEKGAS